MGRRAPGFPRFPRTDLRLTVPPSVNPDDVHVVLNSGGSIKSVTVPTHPTATAGAAGDQINVTFTGKLGPGTIIDIEFTTAGSVGGPLAVQLGPNTRWTNGGNSLGQIVPGQLNLVSLDMPAASNVGLIGLALLILVTGVVMIRKYRLSPVA